MSKLKNKTDEKVLKDIESKLSLKKGLKEEELLEDIDKILEYANSLSSIDIENTDLDKMDKEIRNFSKNMNKKYKDFLPKDNLDSKK
tara:strand:+ start:491 stop:751 length:261 start_codon:yes stop_codon:yes gene_type:complete